MQAQRSIVALFGVAAAYDGLLGIAFLLFPAALLVIFGLLFLNVAWRPHANRNLIPYGILLKVAYCAVVFGHWFTADIPGMWKPLAFADAAFAVLFVWAYVRLGRPAGV